MKKFAVQRRFIVLTLIGIIVSILVAIPFKIAIANHLSPDPQAILTLGGGREREVFTAQFAQSHPNLPIWVSSGSKETLAREIFQDIGINNRRVYIDRRATDTVTNFTTLVKDFNRQKIRHIYLITSDFHLRRARAIAFVVLGNKGITYTPIPIVTSRPTEPTYKVIRDLGRSIFWVFTRRTGSTLNGRKRI